MVYKCMQDAIGPTHDVEVIEAQVDRTMATNRNECSNELCSGGRASVASKRIPEILGIQMRSMVCRIPLYMVRALLSVRPVDSKRANRPMRLSRASQAPIAKNVSECRRLSIGNLGHGEVVESSHSTHGHTGEHSYYAAQAYA